MNIESLIQSLENKATALESKKKVSLEKGAYELFEIFDREYCETLVTLNLVKKAAEEIRVYRAKEIRDKLKFHLLEEIPDLALYFRKESVNKVLCDSLEKAFDRLVEEDFINKIVNTVGEK